MKSNTLFKILIASSLFLGGNLSLAEEGLSINDIRDFFTSVVSDNDGGDMPPTSGDAAFQILYQRFMGDGAEIVETQYQSFNTYMFLDVASSGLEIPPHQQPGITLQNYVVFDSDATETLCSTGKVFVLNKELISARQGLGQSYVFSKDVINERFFPKTVGLERPLQLHDFAAQVVQLLTLKSYSEMNDEDKGRLADLIILASLAKGLKAIYSGDDQALTDAVETARNACGNTEVQRAQVEILRTDTRLIANPLHQMNQIVELFADRGNAPAEFSSLDISEAASFLARITNVELPAGYLQTWVTESSTELLYQAPAGEAASQAVNFVAAVDSKFDTQLFSCANQGYTYLLNPEAPDPSLIVTVIETESINPEATSTREFFNAQDGDTGVSLEVVMAEMVAINQTLQQLKEAGDANPTDAAVVRKVNALIMARFFGALLSAFKEQSQEQIEQIVPIFQGLCTAENGPGLRQTFLTNVLEIEAAPASGLQLERPAPPAAEEGGGLGLQRRAVAPPAEEEAVVEDGPAEETAE